MICQTCNGRGTVDTRREDPDQGRGEKVVIFGARPCPDCLLRLWYTIHDEMAPCPGPSRDVMTSDNHLIMTAGELLNFLRNLGRA